MMVRFYHVFNPSPIPSTPPPFFCHGRSEWNRKLRGFSPLSTKVPPDSPWIVASTNDINKSDSAFRQSETKWNQRRVWGVGPWAILLRDLELWWGGFIVQTPENESECSLLSLYKGPKIKVGKDSLSSPSTIFKGTHWKYLGAVNDFIRQTLTLSKAKTSESLWLRRELGGYKNRPVW